MNKIDIQKVAMRLSQENPRNGMHIADVSYRCGIQDMLSKLAPFLEILMENWDSTDMDIFIAEESCDGTQFHITLPEDEADVFGKEYEKMKQLLLPE